MRYQRSYAEELLGMMVNFIIEERSRLPLSRLLKAIKGYKTRYGESKLYQIKRLAFFIVQSEYPSQDSPVRRDTLVDM